MTSTPTSAKDLPVQLSTLLLSLGSSAIMSLGLEKNPQTGQFEKDLELARFNIDMLRLLKVKTKGNLTPDEAGFIDSLVNDLQLKFVSISTGSHKENT